MISVASAADASGTDRAWLGQLGQCSGWRHTKTYPGGDIAASFTFAQDPDFRHPAVRAGRWVTAYSGARQVFAGRMEQPVPGLPWSITVTGRAALGKDYLAHTSGADDDATYSLNEMLDNAISEGLPWARRNYQTSISGGVADYTTTVDGVLSSMVGQGVLWYVNQFGEFTNSAYVRPVGYLIQAADPPGRTLDGYATQLRVSFYAAASDSAPVSWFTVNADTNTLAKYGRIQQHLDLTGTKPLAYADALSYAQQYLATIRTAGLPWTGAFRVLPGQILTQQGVPVRDLATVEADITVRLIGAFYDPLSSSNDDIAVGQVDYDDDARQLSVTPYVASIDSFVAVLERAHRVRTPAVSSPGTVSLV